MEGGGLKTDTYCIFWFEQWVSGEPFIKIGNPEEEQVWME